MIFNQIALLRNSHNKFSVQEVADALNIDIETFYSKLEEFQYCTRIDNENHVEEIPREISLDINTAYHVLMLIDTLKAIEWRKELVNKTNALELFNDFFNAKKLDVNYISELSVHYTPRQINQMLMRVGLDLNTEELDVEDISLELASHLSFNFFSVEVMEWKNAIIEKAIEHIPEKPSKPVKNNSWQPIEIYDNSIEFDEILKLQSQEKYGLFSSLALAKVLGVTHTNFKATIERARMETQRQNFAWVCEEGWTPIGNRGNYVKCLFIDKNLTHASIMLTNMPTATRWKYYAMSLL